MSDIIHWNEFNVDITPRNIYNEMFRITQVPLNTPACEFLNILIREKQKCNEIQKHMIDFCVSMALYNMSKKMNNPDAIQKLKETTIAKWTSFVDAMDKLPDSDSD